VRTRGVDVRPKLVAQINGISDGLGSDFEGFKFVEGFLLKEGNDDDGKERARRGMSVADDTDNKGMTSKGKASCDCCEDDSKSEGGGQSERNRETLNVLIALHACDTATDDALWSGIRQSVDVIVTAPCCQREI